MKRVWSIKTTAVAAMLTLAAWPVAVGMVGTVAAAPTPTDHALLFAGQDQYAGDVYVSNDATNLYVEIDIASGWCMTESHVAVAASVSGIPQTKTFNPIPGKFPQGDTYPTCATTDTFTFALAGLGDTPVVAVHVKVWDTTSEVTDTVYSGAGDSVYGPVLTYTAPGGSWGPLESAVVPSFASAGVWPTIAGADWISTETIENTTPVPDSWRLATRTLTVPSGAWPVSGSVAMVTADNAERVWANGSVIGTDGEVDVPFTDNHEWATIETYPFTPVAGANTLNFVWRNYGYCEVTNTYCTAPGLNLSPSANPNGLIYKANISYYTHSETAWAGTAVNETPFDGANWATYFTYAVQPVLLETVTVSATNPLGATSATVLANGEDYQFKVTGTVTWTNRNGADLVDAECTSESGGTWAQNAAGYPADLLNLEVNLVAVDWVPVDSENVNGCADNHVYTYDFTGAGATVAFRIYDGTGGVQDLGWFIDNAGALTVQIWWEP